MAGGRRWYGAGVGPVRVPGAGPVRRSVARSSAMCMEAHWFHACLNGFAFGFALLQNGARPPHGPCRSSGKLPRFPEPLMPKAPIARYYRPLFLLALYTVYVVVLFAVAGIRDPGERSEERRVGKEARACGRYDT